MKCRKRQATKLEQATLAWGSLIWSFQCFGYEASVAERKSLATDGSRKSLFQVSPATSSKISQPSAAEVFFSRNSRSSSLTTFQNDEKTVLSTESMVESYGVGYGKDLGAGLSGGVSHQRHFFTNLNKSSGATQTKNETFSQQLSEARASVELAENLDFGVMLRWLSHESHIYGDYNINLKTNFSGTLFGSGAGLLYRFNTPSEIFLSVAIVNPMRGKATLYNEEVVMVEPGRSELSVSGKISKGRIGLSWARMLYKRDERYLTTTPPNGGGANLEAIGLDVDQNSIFLLSTLSVSYDHNLNAQTKLLFGLSRDEIELNLSPLTNAPGQDANSPRQSPFRLQGGLESFWFGMTLGARVIRSSVDETFTSGGVKRVYSKAGTDLQVALSKSL
jgi:hypothetical protein